MTLARIARAQINGDTLKRLLSDIPTITWVSFWFNRATERQKDPTTIDLQLALARANPAVSVSSHFSGFCWQMIVTDVFALVILYHLEKKQKTASEGLTYISTVSASTKEPINAEVQLLWP